MKEIKRYEADGTVSALGFLVAYQDHAAIVAELEVKAEIYDMLCEDYDLAGSLVEFVDMLDTKLKLAEAELAHRDVAAGELEASLVSCAKMQTVHRDACQKAEAELARRDAAAGEPVAYRWEGKRSGKTFYDGIKPLGVDSQPLFTDAQPAALPPEAETHNAPDLGWFERNCWVAGANWMREQAKALGLKPIKLPAKYQLTSGWPLADRLEVQAFNKAIGKVTSALTEQGFTVEGDSDE